MDKEEFSVNGLRLQKELKGEICYPLEGGYKSRKISAPPVLLAKK